MALSTRKSRPPRNACFLRPIEFTFTNDPITPSGELAQAVVLNPIAEALGVDPGKREEVAQAVLDQWRSKLIELQELGWSHIQKSPSLLAAMNCRPTSAFCSGSSTLLCKIQVCPWCYARRITRLLDLIGYGDGDKLTQKMEGLSLHRFWRPVVWEAEEGQLCSTPETILPLGSPDVRTMAQNHVTSCLQQARMLRVFASGVAWWVPTWSDPHKSDPLKPDGPTVFFSPQVLALMPLNAEVPSFQNWTRKTYINGSSTGLDQAEFGRAFRDAFAYPARWLTAPALELKAQLDARSGLKLFGVDGIFRAAPGTGMRRSQKSAQQIVAASP